MAVVLIRYDTVYSDVFSFCYFWATEREQKVHDILANVVFLFTVRMGFYFIPCTLSRPVASCWFFFGVIWLGTYACCNGIPHSSCSFDYIHLPAQLPVLLKNT